MTPSKKKLRPFRTFLIILIAGIIIGCLVKFFMLDFIRTSGKSMTPTLSDNEIICINKMAYGIINPNYQNFIIQWKKPERNDIVIFLRNNKIVVKRCLFIEGDSLEILSDNYYSLKYFLKANEQCLPITKEQAQWLKDYSKVPEGFVFVAGDNLEQSIDSRDYGFVSIKNITGKVMGKD